MLGKYKKYIKSAGLRIRFHFYREHPYNENNVSFPEEAFFMFDARIPETFGKSISDSEKELRKLFNLGHSVVLIEITSLQNKIYISKKPPSEKIDSMKKLKNLLDSIFFEEIDKKLSELEIAEL